MFRKHLIVFIKGFIIGAVMVVPGVSGGTMAVLFGMYTLLIEAASNLFKDFKKNALFLVSFVLGALPGFYLTSKLMGTILDKYSTIVVFFFAGVILAGLPVVVKEAKIKKINWKDIIAILCGIGVIVGITFLPETNTSILSGGSVSVVDVLFLLLVGLMVCVSMVLPGISTFHVLYVFGLYDDVTTAIANLDIMFLLPLGVAIIIGILLLAKVVSYCLKRFPEIVYCVIIGFVIASVVVMFEQAPVGIEWLWSILLFIFGAVGGYLLMNKVGKRGEE